MRFKFNLLILSIHIFVCFGTFAQSKDIKFHLAAINELTGTAIENCDFKVFLEPLGAEIDLNKDKKSIFYKVQPDQKFKVRATSNGYYTEEVVFNSSDFFDEDILTINLNPKEADQAIIKLIDAVSKLPINGEISYSVNGQKVKYVLNDTNPFYVLNYSDNKKFEIKGQSEGYDDEFMTLEFINGGSPIQNTFAIPLKAKATTNRIFVVNNNNEAIKSFDYNFTDKSNKNTKGHVSSGFFMLQGLPTEVYKLSVSADDFIPKTLEFELGKSNPKIVLDSISAISLEIIDAESGKNVTTNAKVTYPNSKTSTLNASNTFIPSQLGNYKFNVSKEGYLPKNVEYNFEKIDQKNEIIRILLNKELETITISVFDAKTKQPLPNASIKLTGDTGNEIEGKIDGHKKSFQLALKSFLNYEIELKGYDKMIGKLGNDKDPKIYLSPILIESPVLSYIFKPTDILSSKIIENTKFKFYRSDGLELKSVFKDNTFVITSKSELKEIKCSGEAEGYKNYNNTFNVLNSSNNLMMAPFEFEKFNFRISDAITNQVIDDAKVTVKLDNKQLPLESKNSFKLQKDIDTYKNEIVAEGYRKVMADLHKSDAKDFVFDIKLIKDDYLVTFKIMNENAKLIVSDAKIAVSNDKKPVQSVLNTKESSFNVKILPDKKYLIEISMNKFEKYSKEFDLNMATKPQLRYDINLVPIKEMPVAVVAKKDSIVKNPEVKVKPIEEPTNLPDQISELAIGKKYRLNGINFEKSRAVFVKGSEKQLTELVNYLKLHKNVKVEITGHTDNEGSVQLNQSLSLFRAKLVSNYMFNNGIPESRITTVGKGSSVPLVKNDTEENKAKNRRVEIEISE